MIKFKNRKEQRARRHARARRSVRGTPERPRMSMMVSTRHMYVQFIDDLAGRTLASASTLKGSGGHNLEAAREVGRKAAEAARERGIERVVVDRGGFRYHGRIKAIVDAAVEGGLSIGRREAAGAEADAGRNEKEAK